MADIDLNLILKLKDNASDEFKKINKEAIESVSQLKRANVQGNTESQKSVDKLSQSTAFYKLQAEKLGNSIGLVKAELAIFNKAIAEGVQLTEEQKTRYSALEGSLQSLNKENEKSSNIFKTISKTLRQFRSQMLVVGLTLGLLGAASAEYAKRNTDIKRSLDEIGLSFRNALSIIGKFISPITKGLGGLAESFNKTFGDKSNNDLERAKNLITEHSQAIENLSTRFQTGKITASEYYLSMLEGQNSVIEKNRQIQQSFNELATLTSQVNNRGLLEFQTRMDEQTSLLNYYKENYKMAHAGMTAFTLNLAQSIQTNLSAAITNIVTGISTAKEAFTALGQAMIQAIVQFMAQKLVAFALEKTLLAGSVASSVAAGAIIAAAYAPAALFANIATFGAAGAAAAASFTAAAASAAASGLLLGNAVNVGLQAGGGGFAEGSPRVPKDMITQVHKNEIIVPETFADSIRKGDLSLSGNNASGNKGNTSIDITINYPRMSSRDEAESLAGVLGNELQRQLRYARGI